MKLVVIQGSARNANNCPGQYGKTFQLVDHILANAPKGVELDLIDLSVDPDKDRVQPCKACVSTAGGYHCIPASERVHMSDGSFTSISEVREGDEVFPYGRVTRSERTGEGRRVYRVKVSDGREIRATEDHLIKVIRPIYSENRKKLLRYDEVWLRTDELEAGDRLPVTLGGRFPSQGHNLIEDRYWVAAGAVFGDGIVDLGKQTQVALYYSEGSGLGEYLKRHFENEVTEGVHAPGMRRLRFKASVFHVLLGAIGLDKSEDVLDRRLPSRLMSGAACEVASFLNGWFCADGTVLRTRHNHAAIRLDSVSYGALRDAQLLLAKLGIRATITDKRHLEQTSFGGGRERASTLCVEGPQANKFMDVVGLADPAKADRFFRREYKGGRKIFWGSVQSVEEDGSEDVYDITVDPTHEFLCEGVVVHNCHWPCSCYGPNAISEGARELPDFMHAEKVYDRMLAADGFVQFSPVNWYAVPTTVKAFWDRMVCASLTLSRDKAVKYKLGKDPDKTRPAFKEGRHDDELRNWLKGKVGAFYIHGDNGADDYGRHDPPPALNLAKEKAQSHRPTEAVQPLVWMCRYMGIHVPDDLVHGAVYGEGTGYPENHEEMPQQTDLFDQALDLVNRTVATIRKL